MTAIAGRSLAGGGNRRRQQETARRRRSAPSSFEYNIGSNKHRIYNIGPTNRTREKPGGSDGIRAIPKGTTWLNHTKKRALQAGTHSRANSTRQAEHLCRPRRLCANGAGKGTPHGSEIGPPLYP